MPSSTWSRQGAASGQSDNTETAIQMASRLISVFAPQPGVNVPCLAQLSQSSREEVTEYVKAHPEFSAAPKQQILHQEAHSLPDFHDRSL